MNTLKFTHLINALTNKDFTIKTESNELTESNEYYIYRILPISKLSVGFIFKTPKNPENFVKSFINQYCKKYKEPNPENYPGTYPGSKKWIDMSDENKEFAYMHHSSNMFSERLLLEQIKENLNNPSIELALCRFGFYETNYGIGIFVLFSGQYEVNAIAKLALYLNGLNIPYKNEYSNARWVYRFVLNISKDLHKDVLQAFHKTL